MEKVRWGILGAARINERLLPAINGSSYGELIAIGSRREGAAKETLQKFAPEAHQVQTFDALEPILENPAIDAVYIPLSNAEHATWVLKAIAAGKHVLCEKPLAIHEADILSIQKAARENQVKVMEGFMYRFHPQHQRVKALIDSGLIGDIRSVNTRFSFMMKPARLYRLSADIDSGGGAMWDIGCYAIHTARMWIPQKAKHVSAMMQKTESGADLSCSGLIDFGDGIRALFDFSFDCTRRSEYEITGTKGTLRCPTVWQLPGDVPEISWHTEDGERGEESPEPANHFECEVAAFSRCILEDLPPPLDLEDALENCRVIRAAIASAQTGTHIRIERSEFS
jgi:D-xylose 1-dehydrogenase (NADP+, D-xylono-1,5-lactone-forming)